MKSQSLVLSPDESRALLWNRMVRLFQLALAALGVAAVYYFSLQVAFAVRIPGSTYSPLYPPGAILLGIVLLTPPRRWWIWLLAAILAHLAFYLPLGTPLWKQSIQMVHTMLLVLLPAAVLRRRSPEAVALTTFVGVLTFLLTAVGTVLLVTLVTATIYIVTGISDSYWLIWQLIAFSNVLPYLTILPTILLVVQHGPRWLQQATVPRIIEAALLSALVITSSELVFGVLPSGPLSVTILRIATLPLLLWAAVRFGTGGVSLAVTAMTIELLWNASLGNGPFIAAAPTQNVLNVPSYFLTFAAPLMLLAALMADRRRDAAALVQLNTQLEERVAARTAELAQTNDELAIAKNQAEAANQAKSDFIATMSHELRTPLHTIMGYNWLIVDSPVPQEHRAHALVVQRSADHLLTLINSVLDLSRIEAGQIPIHETIVDLPRLLDGLVEMFRLQVDAKRLAMRYHAASDLPHYIVTDAVKLRQVLINLLGNAVKFTESGHVTLAVRCEPPCIESEPGEQPTATFVFEVADTGPGIRPNEQQHMFDPFVQTRAGQRKGEGSGLGLAITQQFVQLLGGKLSVSSASGQGAVFTVRIPAQISQIEQAPVEVVPGRVLTLAPGQPEYRVLVVDDHHDNRLLLTAFLASLGLVVYAGRDGEEALQLWQLWQPQLIFLDLRLPKLSGPAVAKQIRATSREAPVIVALSASGFEADGQAAHAEGFDAFIRKPFHATEIVNALHRQLGARFVEAGAVAPTAVPHLPLSLHPAMLAGLSSDQLALLEQASIGGNPQQIAAAIAAVKAQHTDLAATLQAHADQVAFDVILQAVRNEQKARGTNGAT